MAGPLIVRRRLGESDDDYEIRRRAGVLARLERGSRRVGDCVVWAGALNDHGYGLISAGKGRPKVQAHRAAWVARKGDIPAETPHVLHHCDNPPCWADEHLFLGTQADNVRDMHAKGRGSRHHTDKTACPQGHRYDDANTYVNKRGHRTCRRCRNRNRNRNRTKEH